MWATGLTVDEAEDVIHNLPSPTDVWSAPFVEVILGWHNGSSRLRDNDNDIWPVRKLDHG